MSSSPDSLAVRIADTYARFILRRPGAVLGFLFVLLLGSIWASSQLTINSNQLDLISQDLPEVKEVKRVIDMVGGAGHLMLGLRSDDEKTLKAVADDVAEILSADKEHVRSISYKLPVEFAQDNMVLFVKTEDLLEAKKRISAYLKDQLRRANPFYIELQKTEPVKLDLDDLVKKYSSIGKKSIADDYNISEDRKMVLMLVKPMWDSNQLDRTQDFLKLLQIRFDEYSKSNPRGVQLSEDYERMGDAKTVTYGYTGTYKISVDDAYGIESSLEPVTLIAFAAIFLITLLFFRKFWPTVMVTVAVVIGTVYSMAFTWLSVGQLNMVTSILAALLLGFGIDYGIHFTFRTRLELGAGKPYDQAIHDALVNAGRPAFVAAIVTAGSFLVLMVSEFRGFSQFGFLAAAGTLIIGLTMFSFCPALLAVLGRRWPELPKKLVGTMAPPRSDNSAGEIRVPRPGRVLAVCAVVVALACGFAIPWSDFEPPTDRPMTLWERFKTGVQFDYNTRALLPDTHNSVKLQDEIAQRFKISADPIAVYSKDLADTKEVYDELTLHPEKYPAVDQVVSIYTFVPPPEVAKANAQILAQWQDELKELEVSALPPELQDKAAKFKKILSAQPFGVDGVPDIYASTFRHLPTTSPANHGYLTFIYPGIDLWDGKRLLDFADQTRLITTASGKQFRSAGQPILFATLARIVLSDGRLTVLLAGLWILLMHYLDFRSVPLAAASVIPLGLGLVMMLGLMALTDQRLNFMNIIMLPILLGFGVSHGLYLLHRFLEGTSPVVALRSVGAAVATSTLTTVAGFGALLAASHNGLRSMGIVSVIGLLTTLGVSFTVLAAVLQLLHDKRVRQAGKSPQPGDRRSAA